VFKKANCLVKRIRTVAMMEGKNEGPKRSLDEGKDLKRDIEKINKPTVKKEKKVDKSGGLQEANPKINWCCKMVGGCII